MAKTYSMDSEQKKEALASAKAFLKAAKVLNAPENNDEMILMTPCAINTVFSCELFLKVLISKSTGTFKSLHGIYDLFQAFDQNKKASIETAFNKKVDFSKFSNISYNCLTDFLKAENDDFIEWRYSYENTKLSFTITAWIELAEILQSEADK